MNFPKNLVRLHYAYWWKHEAKKTYDSFPLYAQPSNQ